MSSSRSELLRVYAAAAYVVHAPAGAFTIRIGRNSPEADAACLEAGEASWAFVSACNPMSRRLTNAENQKRHESLAQAVQVRGWHALPGEGRSDSGDWPPEASLFILGPARDEAARLGDEFGQLAIVWGAAGGRAELVECRGGAEA